MISSLKLCFTKLYSVQPHREFVLESNNIPECNGQTFKAHEEKIREAALIWMNVLLQQ
jgi:hypothetical protein